MIQFQINKPDEKIREALINRINSLAKPKGSLGRLETLALQIGMIQQTPAPQLTHPVNVIYASDHGIADEGVSQSPKEVTRQVIYNFLNGGSGVCFLARQHGFEIKIVDGGVDYDFPENPDQSQTALTDIDRLFVEAIEKDTEPLVTGEDGLAVLRLLDAMDESNKTGRWVKVNHETL